MKYNGIELEIKEGNCEDCFFSTELGCRKPLTEDFPDCVNDYKTEIIFEIKTKNEEHERRSKSKVRPD